MVKHVFVVFFIFLIFSPAQQKVEFKFDSKDKELPFDLVEHVPVVRPDISLVLSGGGARAISQIGILKVLQENDIPITSIFGTSMGSIVGGLYSAGYTLDEIQEIVLSAPWDEFYSVEDNKRNELFLDQKITEDKAIFALRLDGFHPILPTSISSGQKVSNFLNLLALNAPLNTFTDFNRLLYNFHAVSTNLETGEQVVLNSGSLHKAMRASSSISLLLAPVEIDSMLLVDGGLVSNIPVEAAKKSHPDYIIAADATSPLYTREQLNYPWNIADQMVSIPMRIINSKNINDANILLKPELHNRLNGDFSQLDSAIQSGYDCALVKIDSIKQWFHNDVIQKAGLKNEALGNLVTVYPENSFEKKVIARLTDSSNITLNDIYYAAYQEFESGNYKSFGFSIESDSLKKVLKIDAELNPLIVDFKVEGATRSFFKDININFAELLYKPYNPQILLKKLMDVLRAYRREGFCLATIDSVKFSPATKSLFISISEGMINELVVEGNEKSDETIITREFPLEQGEYFKCSAAKEGLSNLRSTNLFNEIDLDIEHSNGNNKLDIRVKEKISSIIRFGLTIDNEYLSQFSVDVRDENLFGTGTELGAIYNGALKKNSFEVEQKANRIFNTYLTYKIKAYAKNQDINVYSDDSSTNDKKFSRSKIGEYTQTDYGVSLGIGTQVEKIGNLIVEAKYQQDKIRNIVNNPVSEYKTNISTLTFRFNIDSQNKYPFPTNGLVMSANYETAQSFFGSKLGYTKFDFLYELYISLSERSTIRPKVIVGFADATLPLGQQFAFGGLSNFFGYRQFEYRGRQIFISSFEYRFKLPFKLFFESYLKGRYDLGSIWTQKEEIRLKDLRHGIGVSIALDTPIGPADFSIGRSFLIKNKIENNYISWGPVNFYFSIGYNF